MSFRERLYQGAALLLPRAYHRHAARQLVYAGERTDAVQELGAATVLALLAAVGVMLIPFARGTAFGIVTLSGAAAAALLVELAAYFVLYLKVQDRTRRVEQVLPDALQLIGSNIRAGMTPFQALRLAARKEFGPLEEEIRFATARALGTESFSDALLSMSQRVKSEMLSRALKLFTTAMRSGGHLATLLEELARDMVAMRALKKELVTSTKTYTIFVLFTIIIGMPLLLAISLHFITVITGLQAIAGLRSDFGLGFLAGEITITADFMLRAAVVMLLVTSLLACALLGVIAEGKPAVGFRYAPAVIAGSLIAFVVLRAVLQGLLGG